MLFFISTLVVSFLESFGIAILLPIFEKILGQNTNSQISSILLYPFELFGLENDILFIGIFFLFIILLKIIFRLFTTYLSNKVCFDIREKIMLEISDYYLTTSYENIIKSKQGLLLNNIIQEPYKTTAGLLKISEFIVSIIMIFFYYALLLLTDVKITIYLSIISIFIYYLITVTTKKYSIKFGEEEIEINQDISSIAAESIAALRQIKTFGMNNKISNQLSEKVKKLSIVELKKLIFMTSPRLIIELIFTSGIIFGVMFFYFTSFETLKTIIPILAIFVLVSQRLLGQLSIVVANKIALDNIIPSFSLVVSLMDKNKQSKKLYTKNINFNFLETDIIFNNVTFSYDIKKPIIKNASFTIPRNKITAIIGESGSGKSTIADLVLGLYEPSSGEIYANNENIKDLNIKDWRAKIGFVSQDNFLFHASILENISYGNVKSTHEEIINCSKKANAHKFIKKLPLGYNTIVGDRGALVSGGQKQRIAIARAIIRNPDILIFDEATSALDSSTELSLQKEILKISKGKTVIIISHRNKMIQKADKILKIENSHVNLIKFNEVF